MDTFAVYTADCICDISELQKLRSTLSYFFSSTTGEYVSIRGDYTPSGSDNLHIALDVRLTPDFWFYVIGRERSCLDVLDDMFIANLPGLWLHSVLLDSDPDEGFFASDGWSISLR